MQVLRAAIRVATLRRFMARARDMSNVLRIAFVWLLVLVAVPCGRVSVELAASDECATWCPCEDGLSQGTPCEADEDCEDDCEDHCEDDCDGCCHARTPLAVGPEQLSSTPMVATSASTPLVCDAPGRRLSTDVFRPPRSLT